MSNLKQEGTLLKVFEKVQITEKFAKREFVLEIGDKYKEFVKFQLTNDKCDLIAFIEEGAPITVHFNLRGKPYEKNGVTSYFANLECWKIEKEGKTENTPEPPTMVRKSLTKEELKIVAHTTADYFDEEEGKDLPF